MEEEREPAFDPRREARRRHGACVRRGIRIAYARQPLARLDIAEVAGLLLDVGVARAYRDLRLQSSLLQLEHGDLPADAGRLAPERVVLQRHAHEARPDERGEDEEREVDQATSGKA